MSNFWGAIQKRPVFFVDRNEISAVAIDEIASH